MNKKVLIIIGAIVGALILGIGVAVAIHSLQKNNSAETTVQEEPETTEQKTEKAKQAYDAALVAMNEGKKDEAIKQLDIAKKYYTQLDDQENLQDVLGQYDVANAIPPRAPVTTVETR